MRRPSIDARWRNRVLGGAALGLVGYAAAIWLDFEPQPLAYVVMAVIVGTLVLLVVDTVDVPVAHWRPGLAPRGDRVTEATSDLRILASHQQADHPSDALTRRLVALAATRDPDLAELLRIELAAATQLRPIDIDRILTRIEDVRDPR